MTTATGDNRFTAALAKGNRYAWIKASRSVATNACVELAQAGDLIALRDSKNPDVAPFFYSHAEIDAFLHGVKQGEFDHLLRDA